MTLLELWRAGRITTAQLTVAERERLNVMVIHEAIEEAKRQKQPKKAETA